MCKKLLPILVLFILVASALVGCGQASSTPSTLTILSITEGDVFVMKAGTDDWIEAQVEMSLEVGDTIKTGDGSGTEITFFDGSTIELQAGTEIEIASLDISTDTGATTITLMQTIGTTISRVTKLLDPASRYEIETPTGAAVVRGSWLTVIVEYVTPQIIKTWIINQEGNIWAIGQGVELQVPEGQTCIIILGQPPNIPNIMPLAEDDAAITDEDTPVTVATPGVLNNDSDPDVGDTLTVTSMNTSGTVGTVTAWADGSFTYDPNGQFEYLEAGSSTTDSFTYTVFDGNGGTDTATVTITINGVNDAPTDISLDNNRVAENQPSGKAVGFFSTTDPDTGDTFTYSLVSGDGAYHNAGFTIVGSQLQTATTFDYETKNFYSIRVRTTDSGTLYYEEAFIIVITDFYETPVNYPPMAGVNDAPTDISLDNSSVAENQPSGTAVGFFSTTDPDTGDTFTYSLVSGDGAHHNAFFTIVGSQLQTAAIFDYETQNSYSIRVRTTDSGPLYYEEAFIITVTDVYEPPVNYPPTAVDDSATTQQGTPVTIDVLNNDSDSDGHTLTVDSVTQGTHGSVTNNGNDVTYTPNSGFTGTDTFTYTISDGNGGTDTATVTVTVIETPATPATIGITIDTGMGTPIYIWDNTTNAWVTNGNQVTPKNIEVAGGHSYCVWVGGDVTYDVGSCPGDWSVSSAPNGGQQACGIAAAGSNHPVHFTESAN